MKICENKPLIVVDGGLCHPWALKRLGLEYFHETFGERNRIERWLKKLKERTKRSYNNINTNIVKSIEEIATAIALLHNIIAQNNKGGVILT